MAYKVITNCPVCSKTLKITKLQCSHCHTTIDNKFELSKLASLSKDQLHFVEVFLTCRGNINEVEKEMGISYPTVSDFAIFQHGDNFFLVYFIFLLLYISKG